jgi:hypothetical protein
MIANASFARFDGLFTSSERSIHIAGIRTEPVNRRPHSESLPIVCARRSRPHRTEPGGPKGISTGEAVPSHGPNCWRMSRLCDRSHHPTEARWPGRAGKYGLADHRGRQSEGSVGVRSLNRMRDCDAFAAFRADERFDCREAGKGVQRSAVRTASATHPL